MIEHAAFAPDSPPDLATRQAALDPTRSFAVSAPAGSGKTGLLTQRVLQLLTTCQEPEEILAITFTRKAAGEMQERILQALWDSRGPEPENPHAQLTWRLARAAMEKDREHNWNLLFSPQRLRVQTIDSLCRAITRQLPLASGLGAQPDTLSNTDKAYRLAVRALLERLEDRDSPLQADLTRLLVHLDNNLTTVENLLVAMLAKREQWLDILLQARHQEARDYLQSVLDEIVTSHLQQLHQQLWRHGPALCAIADRAAANLREEPSGKEIQPWGIEQLAGISGLPPATASARLQWRQLVELLLTGGGTFRQRLTKAEGFPAGNSGRPLKEDFARLVDELRGDNPHIEALLQATRELPPPAYGDDEWQLLDSLTRLLPVLTAHLKLVFQQLGATDFTEITRAALTALGDEDNPGEIALQLDYRIRHILVDEFQDTASPQLQLLEQLTAGWQPGDGRTLFIVGDGMQSCYGFRNANVGIFLGARQQGIGSVALEAIDLTVNFRSQTGVVDWVNRTFADAFPAESDITRGAVSYSPSIAARPLRDGPAVSCYICPYDGGKKNPEEDDEDNSVQRLQAVQQEAQTVARLASEALATTQGSVAILVRNRSHLQAVLPALAAAGLTWLATEIDRLSSRMAIVDLISLTRALLDPGDRVAWLAVLRAPWCGLDLFDLHRLVTADVSPRLREGAFPMIYQQLLHFERIDGLSDQAQQALQRLRQVLQPAIDQRQRKPLRQWVEGVWLALGGPACLADPDDLNNIPGYFSLLDQYQQAGVIRDWEAFNTAVNDLYAEPRSDANPRLQVMTIHKSKGLEFDTVIIPGLDRSPRSNDKQLLLWQERIGEDGESRLLLGPLAATGEDQSPLYRFMSKEAELQQRFEATRLLYVGCTRAVNRLYLLGCLIRKEEQWNTPGKASLLASIWPQIVEQVETPPATDTRARPAAPRQLAHILRLPANWQRPPLEDVQLLQAYRGREFGDEDNIPEADSLINRLARHTGSVLHRALQVVVNEQRIDELSGENLTLWISQQRPWWQLQLQTAGWQHQWLEQALKKVGKAFLQTLQDDQGRWLLDHRHPQSACELSLHYWQAQQWRESIVDRTFVVDQVRWIVDYKTSEPLAGQSEEDFIAQEIASYTPQLRRYRQGFAGMEEREIRTALYFPMLNRHKFVEVTD